MGTQQDGIRFNVKEKILEKYGKPSIVVAIAQDQDGNLQSNNTDECFIDCSTKLEFGEMPVLC